MTEAKEESLKRISVTILNLQKYMIAIDQVDGPKIVKTAREVVDASPANLSEEEKNRRVDKILYNGIGTFDPLSLEMPAFFHETGQMIQNCLNKGLIFATDGLDTTNNILVQCNELLKKLSFVNAYIMSAAVYAFVHTPKETKSVGSSWISFFNHLRLKTQSTQKKAYKICEKLIPGSVKEPSNTLQIDIDFRPYLGFETNPVLNYDPSKTLHQLNAASLEWFQRGMDFGTKRYKTIERAIHGYLV